MMKHLKLIGFFCVTSSLLLLGFLSQTGSSSSSINNEDFLTYLPAVLGGSATSKPTIEQKIAFSSDRDGNFEIYVMKTDGSDVTRLTNNGAADFLPA
jgi:hypothetical protein